MSELKPAPCSKCGEQPEVQDKRIRFVVICNCETPANYVFGNSVGFLDYIENEDAAQIAFDAINVNELKRTAIEAWNKKQENQRLTAIATKQAARADELYEALEGQIKVLKGYKELMIHPLSLNDDIKFLESTLDKSRIEAEGE